MFSDIELSKLIFTKTPQRFHPYIKISRLDRPIGIWLLLFPCWWSILLARDGLLNMGLREWWLVFLFALGAVLMRAAGCIINDLWDQKIDQAVERTRIRPLASGEMTQKQALRFLAGLLAVSFLILLCLSSTAIILGLISIIPVVVYPLMKRVTWWPQAFLGLTFNWGALMGYAAVNHHVGAGAILLYLGGIFWTLGYDTIYACQDKEDDAMVGIKSTALLFSTEAPRYVRFFFSAAIMLFVVAKYTASPSILTPMLLLPVGYYTYRTLKKWDMNNPASCLATFKAQHVLGWLVLAMLAL